MWHKHIVYLWLRTTRKSISKSVLVDMDFLTLNMQGPNHIVNIIGAGVLVFVSPEHQHPWYWLCRIGKFLSYTREISTTCVMPVWRNDINCRYIFTFPIKNLACNGLTGLLIGCCICCQAIKIHVNKANLRDLIAVTGLLILLKLD